MKTDTPSKLLNVFIHDLYFFYQKHNYKTISIHYEGYGKDLGCTITGGNLPIYAYYKKYIVKKFKK